MKSLKILRNAGLCLFLISAFFFILNSQLYAESKKSPSQWISDAEKVHTINNMYTVEVVSEMMEKDISIQNLKSANKHRALMSYNKENGLRGKEAGSSSLVLDIQSFLSKTEGKVQWSVENGL